VPRAALAVVLLAAGGCSGASPAPTIVALRATAAEVSVEFDRPVALRVAALRDDAGDVALRLPAAGARSTFRWPARLPQDAHFSVELTHSEGTLHGELDTPGVRGALRASVALPLGQQEHALREGTAAPAATVMVPAGGQVTLALVVENLRQAPIEYEWRVELPPDLDWTSDDGRFERDGASVRLRGRLDVAADFDQAVAQVQVRDGAVAAVLEFALAQWTSAESAQPPDATLHARYELRPALVEELSHAVRVVDVVFPADAAGGRLPDRPADKVVFPDRFWTAVRRALAGPGALQNPHAAAGQQAVWLANESDAPLSLVVQSEVAADEGSQPLDQFAPPVWLSPRASATAEHLLLVGPGETAAARIPVFVRPDAASGVYQRRFRVYALGSSEPLAEFSRPLAVRRDDPWRSAAAVGALALAGCGACLAAGFGHRAAARLSVEQLAAIGLVAGLHFGVSYTARVGGALLGVLGPLAVFVSGVADEGLAALLLAVAVTLAPRPGTFALSTLAVFLLNALASGQMGLVDVLFVALSATLGEGALALAGVTTTSAAKRPAVRAPAALVLRVAVALGLANAATLALQFCLSSVLLRLYFAPWYIVAVALVAGLLYGGLGAAAGTRLGYRLRRTWR
jgi:hypothetical protein